MSSLKNTYASLIQSYWDLFSGISLPDCVRNLLRKDRAPELVLPARIKEPLQAFMRAPEGHSSPRPITLRWK